MTTPASKAAKTHCMNQARTHSGLPPKAGGAPSGTSKETAAAGIADAWPPETSL